jgi:DNA-damage-inducible protein D
MKALYEAKGYSKQWIDKRLRGIAIRQDLTQEWQNRGINAPSDFAILTAEICKATFGLTPNEYKQFKNLPNMPNVNLRDNMDVTSEISENEMPDTFEKNKTVAKRGGAVAGNAKKETEKEIGRKVSTEKNPLDESKRIK